jgi:hypothetical protein
MFLNIQIHNINHSKSKQINNVNNLKFHNYQHAILCILKNPKILNFCNKSQIRTNQHNHFFTNIFKQINYSITIKLLINHKINHKKSNNSKLITINQ